MIIAPEEETTIDFVDLNFIGTGSAAMKEDTFRTVHGPTATASASALSRIVRPFGADRITASTYSREAIGPEHTIVVMMPTERMFTIGWTRELTLIMHRLLLERYF